MSAPLVEEAVVRMNVNGVHTHTWRCTPTDLEALAIGRLFIDGLITSANQAHLIVGAGSDALVIEARVGGATAVLTPVRGSLPIPDPDIFAELFRSLFHLVDERHEHGGMHAAAATNGAANVIQVEDVGRHNTIDKLVGALLLRGASPSQHGLLTSSRVSGEIADKAARAGFVWLASRSIPTNLAVSFARDAHMPIIGRAAGKSAFIYQ
jgi:FdhD protein